MRLKLTPLSHIYSYKTYNMEKDRVIRNPPPAPKHLTWKWNRVGAIPSHPANQPNINEPNLLWPSSSSFRASRCSSKNPSSNAISRLPFLLLHPSPVRGNMSCASPFHWLRRRLRNEPSPCMTCPRTRETLVAAANGASQRCFSALQRFAAVGDSEVCLLSRF